MSMNQNPNSASWKGLLIHWYVCGLLTLPPSNPKNLSPKSNGFLHGTWLSATGERDSLVKGLLMSNICSLFWHTANSRKLREHNKWHVILKLTFTRSFWLTCNSLALPISVNRVKKKNHNSLPKHGSGFNKFPHIVLSFKIRSINRASQASTFFFFFIERLLPPALLSLHQNNFPDLHYRNEYSPTSILPQ